MIRKKWEAYYDLSRDIPYHKKCIPGKGLSSVLPWEQGSLTPRQNTEKIETPAGLLAYNTSMISQSPDAPVPLTAQITCSQCGGELHPDEGQLFLSCPYCGATVYLDRSRVVFHWYVASTLKDQDAAAALYRWMSGSQTVKDLDKKAKVVGQSFEYFPVWYFKWDEQGKEQVALQPAAATSITELGSLKIPAGDLRKYDPALDSQAEQPTVPLESGLEWVKQKNPGVKSAPGQGKESPTGQGGDYSEASLVHIPLYFFKYDYAGSTYTALVDAASGTVLASLFPAKRETPYVLVGMVTALVYLCLALIPLVMSDGRSGGTGMLICSGVGLVAAPILFAWAFWVASKV